MNTLFTNHEGLIKFDFDLSSEFLISDNLKLVQSIMHCIRTGENPIYNDRYYNLKNVTLDITLKKIKITNE